MVKWFHAAALIKFKCRRVQTWQFFLPEYVSSACSFVTYLWNWNFKETIWNQLSNKYNTGSVWSHAARHKLPQPCYILPRPRNTLLWPLFHWSVSENGLLKWFDKNMKLLNHNIPLCRKICNQLFRYTSN